MAINLSNITGAMIDAAARTDDLDAALKPMMDAARIESGDVAGVAFSSIADNAFNADHWPHCSHAERVAAIREWIETERSHLD